MLCGVAECGVRWACAVCACLAGPGVESVRACLAVGPVG